MLSCRLGERAVLAVSDPLLHANIFCGVAPKRGQWAAKKRSSLGTGELPFRGDAAVHLLQSIV